MPQPKMNGSEPLFSHTDPRGSPPPGENMPPERVWRPGETAPSQPNRSMWCTFGATALGSNQAMWWSPSAGIAAKV